MNSGKKMRVALLGNSHASAIKNGWEEWSVASQPIEMTFFARPNGQGGLDSLKCEGNALVPADPALQEWFVKTAGCSRIMLDDYDYFWIYGFGPEYKLTCSMAEELSKTAYSKSLMMACMRDFKETIAANFKKSPLFALAHLLRSVTEKPIYISTKPLFAETHAIAAKKEISATAGLAVFAAQTEAIADLFAEIGAIPISQPSGTITGGCFTRKEFAMKDDKHMNNLYGREMISAFITSISK